MSPSALRTLRIRLGVFLGVALALAIAVPTVLLVRESAGRTRSERDDRVTRAAQAARYLVGEDGDTAGDVDVSTYTQTPATKGQPLSAILDKSGDQIAADRNVRKTVRHLARTRSRRQQEDPVSIDGLRMTALSIEGEGGQIGTALAFEPTAAIEHDLRSDRRTAIGAALAAWLLLTGAGVLLIGRALRPATTVAAREQAFLADAAHELRTPWAIVRGRAENALRTGPRAEDVQAIADVAAGAGDAIGDMLELARLDSGRAVSERERLQLGALAQTCADDRADAAAQAGVALRTVTGEPVVVSGDERLLARAVGNLIDNALCHGAAGGEVLVSVSAASGQARLTVSDRGAGISPGQRERVFDRFQRGSSAAAGGSGLGLPIARLVAEAHGGTLTLEDPPAGQTGAVFVLSLPIS